MTAPQIRINLPDKVKPLFSSLARYVVLWGGRGSAKSESVARMLILRSMEAPLRILCARQYQSNISESVHSMLVKIIKEYNLDSHFTVQERSIKNKWGSEFLFAGLNEESIAGLKSMVSPDIVWIEEASSITQNTWAKLDPTIRAEGSQIWCTLNREMDKDPISRLFIVSEPPPDSIVIEMEYWDNPWFPQVLKNQMIQCRATDYEAYLHIWEGQPIRHSQASVFKGKFISKAFAPDEDLWSPLFGMDFGFSVDPTVLTKSWVYEDRLYVEHELYEIGLETEYMPDAMKEIPGAVDHIIYADSARPETISFLRRHGFPRIRSVDKWKGSVQDGVERMRSFNKIVVHPRCVHTLEELANYSYKIDRNTGLVLPEIVQKEDHCLDSLRYSLTPLIKGFKLKQKVPDREADLPLDQYGRPQSRPQSEAYARQQLARMGTNWALNL